MPSREATAPLHVEQAPLQQLRPGWLSPQPAQRLEGLLTARETEVLQEIVNGASNAEISTCLNISQETVKSHMKSILQKLKARDRTQAVVMALRASLVSLPD